LNVEESTVTWFEKISLGGRQLAKAGYLLFLFVTGSLRQSRLLAARQGVFAITLHRVLPDQDFDSAQLEPGMAVRASTFERFLEYITRYCEWVLPENAAAAQPNAASSRRPRIALTFDDGWKDNFDVAFPLSRKHGVRFAVFLCPQVMNRKDSFWTTKVQDLWWAAHRAGKLNLLRTVCGSRETGSADSLIASLKHAETREREALILELQSVLRPYARVANGRPSELLSWPEVKNMSQAGVVFGSHTQSHAILTDLPIDEAMRELTESKSAIEAELGACTWFAYPNGDWSPQVRNLVEQAGYRAAFINSPGVWHAGSDPFVIPRVNVWEGSLTGFGGRFSRRALEYAIFWKAQQASAD
jgi:peptidoglycan/xylan/chitin deacetylase (PgdA/CDA1 family)